MTKINLAHALEREMAQALALAWINSRTSDVAPPGYAAHYFHSKDLGCVFKVLNWDESQSVRVEVRIQPACNVAESAADRYPMSNVQHAQIDCRVDTCRYYTVGGNCINSAPAITLKPGKAFTCWSFEDKGGR